MLTTQVATIDPGGLTFTLTVPGHQRWTIRTLVAVALTQAGGAPTRGYVITVNNAETVVARAAAMDAGTEPATVTITWANSAQGAIGSGNVGTSVAPFPNMVLEPGYTITGEILNPALGDAWASGLAWFDFDYTE